MHSLQESGALWNTFIFVADIRTLLDLCASSLPRLYISFAQLLPISGTPSETVAVQTLYAKLSSEGSQKQFSRSYAQNLLFCPSLGSSGSGSPKRPAPR